MSVASTWQLDVGDCLDPIAGLASLSDRSVDHVISDPPFSAYVNKNSATSKGGRTRKKSIGIGVMSAASIDTLVAQSCRIASRWLVFFCDFESAHLYKEALERHGGRFVRTCAWCKPDCAPQFSGDRPGSWGEAIVVGHATNQGRMRWNGRGRRGVYTSGICRGKARTAHPTQKPLGLMLELVRDFTNEGDLVLDPYVGSGTTAVACMQLGRRFLGWELDPTWAEIARSRLSGDDGAVREAAADASEDAA